MLRVIAASATLGFAALGVAAESGVAAPAATSPADGTTADAGGAPVEGSATDAWRFGGGFTTGRQRARRDGEQELRRVEGGRGFVEWRRGGWRGAAGLRALSLRVTEADDAGAVGERRGSFAGGVLGGYEGSWIGGELGVGVSSSPHVGGGERRAWLPAAALRVGPADLLFAEATLLDVAAASPGPGLARAGLGAVLGGGRLWAGWSWDEHGDGCALAGQVAISERVGFSIGAALDPRAPGDHLLLEAGLVLRWAAEGR